MARLLFACGAFVLATTSLAACSSGELPMDHLGTDASIDANVADASRIDGNAPHDAGSIDAPTTDGSADAPIGDADGGAPDAPVDTGPPPTGESCGSMIDIT